MRSFLFAVQRKGNYATLENTITGVPGVMEGFEKTGFGEVDKKGKERRDTVGTMAYKLLHPPWHACSQDNIKLLIR